MRPGSVDPVRPGRAGFTLVEVLVALVILGLGSTVSIQLLGRATREIEGAEVGLRAALLLSEWGGATADGPAERPAGPGRIVYIGSPGGPEVRFEPPEGGVPPTGPAGSGGYLEEREWSLVGP